MSVIKAGTTLTTAYTVEADTTGALEFKTGPSATLAMSISASGVVTFPATTGFDIASANITNLTSGTTSATVLRSASGTITNLLATTATVSASTYLATASGSVGIGTSSPQDKLSVLTAQGLNTAANPVMTYGASTNWAAGFANIYDASYVDQFMLLNARMTGGTRAAPTFNANSPANGGIALKVDGLDGGLAIQTIPNGTGQSATTRLYLNPSGNLGIGTSSPGSKLEVSGVGTFTAGTQETWGSSGLTFGASRLMRQMESTSTAREYICGPDTSTYGTYEFYTARSNGSPTLAYGVNTSGNVFFGKNISIGNVTPTTSGTGITFPATQSDSSNANTLDDYEEGTWTPSVGGNSTYSTQKGFYTKIGRSVTAMFDIVLGSVGTGSTSQIGGLPFTSAPSGSPQGIVAPVSYWAGLSVSVYWLAFRIDESSTTMLNQYTTGAQTTATVNGGIIQDGTRIIGTITYFV